MKTFTARKLKQEQPELFAKVHEAYELVMPHIKDHVISTIINQPAGAVAVHATFLRIQDTKTEEILFVEIQVLFKKLPGGAVLPGLGFVNFYDSFEAYEEERKNVMKDSTQKYGNEDFPTYLDFPGGKRIKTNDN
jgi:hypothetical protein